MQNIAAPFNRLPVTSLLTLTWQEMSALLEIRRPFYVTSRHVKDGVHVTTAYDPQTCSVYRCPTNHGVRVAVKKAVAANNELKLVDSRTPTAEMPLYL